MPTGRSPSWSEGDHQATLVARNVLTDYIAIAVDMGLGLVMLPFNVSHLGQAAYGLWVLSTSVTTYFSMLDLGYGSAQVKFAAQYRALRDADALNEITSTLFFLFTGLAVAMYVAASIVAYRLGDLFALGPDQAATGRWVLMIVSAHIALGLPFSVFGGVTNGFQRFYLNNIISIVTSVVVALATVVVLLRGHGLLELVAVTTSIRIAALFAYRATAYRAFPLLSVRWRLVRRTRLREVTAFSIFLLAIDIAQKINYSADTMVIGAFMGTAAIATWSVGARLILAVRTLSQVLGRLLFPTIVDGATRGNMDRLQRVLTQGTRLSLAMVTPMALVLALLADRIVAAWVGPRFTGSVIVVQLLAVVVTLRIGAHTAYTLLKGGGHHRFAAAATMTVALSNLVLSIVLVKRFGLAGIAIGTLIPITISSVFAVVPKACRRAGLPIASFVRQAVWPALWPTIPAAAAVLAVRATVPGVACIVLGAAAGSLIYALAFLCVAVGGDDRRWYLTRALDTFRGSRPARPSATVVAS